MIKKLLQN